MVDKLRKLADWERDWGALARWVLSIVFFLVVYSLLHFADIHYVRRAEFALINAKLDALVSTVTQDTIRLQDVQDRITRIENREDRANEQGQTGREPGDIAKK